MPSQKQRNANEYKGRSQRTQVYKNPDVFLGSDQKAKRDVWLFIDGKLEKRAIRTPEVIEQVAKESFSNGVDNILNTLKDEGSNDKTKYGPIEIKVKGGTMSIKNGGAVFPIEEKEFKIEGTKKKQKMWIPQAALGRLNTGTNYDKDREVGIGKNGLGAKGANIFSTEYKVEVNNTHSKQNYKQTWTNNMKNVSEPKIIKSKIKENYVKITYTLDFARFGYKENVYGPDELALFERHCIDYAFGSGIPIIFNGTEYHIKNIEEYAGMYFPEAMDEHVVWKTEKAYTKTKSKKLYTPESEIMILNSPHESHKLGFINGLLIPDGGTFIDEIMGAVSKPIISKLNTEGGTKLSAKNVSDNIIIIANCTFRNPVFDRQSKIRLTNQDVKYPEPDKKILNKMRKWSLMDILSKIQAQNFAKKTDGKKTKDVFIKGSRDAYYAGTKFSKKCALLLSEGKSAANYFNILSTLYKNGKDWLGGLPLRGKGLNVRKINLRNKRSAKREAENREIAKFKKMMGLKEGVDYSIEANFNKLRYGQIWIYADQDDDGSHIIGIIVNYIACRFPELLKKGIVSYPSLPYVRATKGKKGNEIKLSFYSMAEFRLWEKEHKGEKGWTIKFFKGLGTSNKSHIIEDFNNPRKICLTYGRRDEAKLELVFGRKHEDLRKLWIAEYKEATADSYIYDDIYKHAEIEDEINNRMERVYYQPTREFLDIKVREYSITNIRRSIPYRDGLKQSQRDLIWGSLVYWKSVKDKDFIRASQFALYVSKLVHYIYGDNSIPETLKRMIFEYVGKNNIPYIADDGGTGTREEGGPDCSAPRYYDVGKIWWLSYIYRKEDEPLLKMIYEDDKAIKPYIMRPIICMSLVNGATGIASGWSTNIPNYNPEDIIDYHITKIKRAKKGRDDVPDDEIVPWYRYFKGSIKQKNKIYKSTIIKPEKDREGSETVKEDIDLAEEEFENRKTGGSEVDDDGNEVEEQKIYRKSIITKGSFVRNEDGSVTITELPIGTWTLPYCERLKLLMKEKKLIADVRDLSNDYDINITVKPIGKSKTLNVKSLKLTSSIPLENMVLLDNNGIPHRYSGANEILEEFHNEKLGHYKERLKYQIKNTKEDLRVKSERYRYVKAVNDGKLVIQKREDDDILEDMVEMKFDKSLYTSTTTSQMSKTGMAKLKVNIIKIKEELEILMNTDSRDVWLKELLEFKEAYLKHYEKKEAEREKEKQRILKGGKSKAVGRNGKGKGKAKK